jgi:hypothetical protein
MERELGDSQHESTGYGAQRDAVRANRTPSWAERSNDIDCFQLILWLLLDTRNRKKKLSIIDEQVSLCRNEQA